MNNIKITIDMVCPECHMDDLYDNNIVLYRKYTRAKEQLCPYRVFDLDSVKAYCKFPLVIKNYKNNLFGEKND